MRMLATTIGLLAMAALVPPTLQAQGARLITSHADVQAVFAERGPRDEPVRRRLRRRRVLSNLTPVEARAIFDVQLALAWTLVHIDPQPADANGALRRWDQNARNVSQFTYFPPTTSPHDCNAPEIGALIGTTGLDIGAFRGDLLLDSDSESLDEARRTLLASLAARRLAADRAADRRARGLSCEDLPERVAWGVGVPTREEPEGLWWSINVALLGEAVQPELRAAGEREAATMLAATSDALVAATPEAVASFLAQAAASRTPSCGSRHTWTRTERAAWSLIGFVPPDSTWLGYWVTFRTVEGTADARPTVIVLHAEGAPACDEGRAWSSQIARSADGALVAGAVERQ